MAFVLAAVATTLALGAPSAHAQSRYRNYLDKWEIHYSDADFKQLDTFEAHSLTKADKAYNAKNYKQAHALYESFVLEFGKSKATPFALLRVGRCRHKLLKRHKAVAEYQEVLDYFPNATHYAAAALYYQGLCYWEDGDEKMASTKWMAMAKDADYAKHFLAAPAFNQLAAGLTKAGQADKAVVYYQKVAVNFRGANRDAFRHAMEQVVHHHVRANPNEPKLRAFYQSVQGFNLWRPTKITGDLVKDRSYWSSVRSYIKIYGRFKPNEAALRERYYQLWADQMAGKFPDWDGFQLDVARFRMIHEKDAAKWCSRLDGQFGRYQKAGDHDRVLRWIGEYARHPKKVKEYYTKLDFAKMTPAQTVRMIRLAFDDVGDKTLAQNVFIKLRLKDMPDTEKVGLARYLWAKDGELVKRTCAAMADADLGRMELLRYFRGQKDHKEGVPLADRMAVVAKYAAEALWTKAELLQIGGQYTKAIAAYKACNNPPDNIWKIAECHASLKQLTPAVAELRQVESFFRKRYGPQAALRVAHLYRQFKLKTQYVAELRAILKKYPKSRESSSAHVELERMGYTPGGGENASD